MHFLHIACLMPSSVEKKKNSLFRIVPGKKTLEVGSLHGWHKFYLSEIIIISQSHMQSTLHEVRAGKGQKELSLPAQTCCLNKTECSRQAPVQHQGILVLCAAQERYPRETASQGQRPCIGTAKLSWVRTTGSLWWLQSAQQPRSRQMAGTHPAQHMQVCNWWDHSKSCLIKQMQCAKIFQKLNLRLAPCFVTGLKQISSFAHDCW